MHNTVLVLDGNEFSTLSIVRSLGRQNLTVTVGAEVELTNPISQYSKHTNNLYKYPDPLTEADRFITHITEYLSNNNFDLLIPVTEKTTLILAQYREQIEQYTRLALPDYKTLQLVSNKDQTFKIAHEEGIPIPQGVIATQATDLKDLAQKLTYPIVIKPSQSVANSNKDTRVKLTVQYAFNSSELIKKSQDILQHTPVILQEYFRGDGVGVEILANHGDIIMAFQHKRLHELPLTGGGSCLRESVTVNPQLLEYATRLIKRLNWHGVAMIEFKYNNTTQQSCLMEINGRFWGSLPLAISAGADFPYHLYRMLVHNETNPKPNIKIGKLNRKFKDDLYWYILVLLRRDNNPLIIWPNFSQICRDLIVILSPQHRFDSFDYDDPKPLFADLALTSQWFIELAQEFITQRYWQIKFNRQKKSGMAIKALKATETILFLCYGNINRSAAAQKCLEKHLATNNHPAIESTGFHIVNQRPADPNMVSIAKKQDVDLSNWSSNTVNKDMIERAGIIYVMEIAHYLRLVSEYPTAKHKTYLLGSVIKDPKQMPLELIDPYGKSPETYEEIFNYINTATKVIATQNK